MKKLHGKSVDILADNIAKIKQLFPEVFTEDKIDFERLQEVLGEYVDDKEERYRFEWNGNQKLSGYLKLGYRLPDIITYLQNETKLTRKTLAKILLKSKRIEDFKNNPQKFMDEVSDIIKRKMRHLIIDGIKYEKLGEEDIYVQELFENKELYGYLHKNMIATKKSIYDHVIYDSGNEESFAKKFEANDRVKVYTKLPSWFVIDTPLGGYNPDWAVFIEKDGAEKLFFVIETKGNIIEEQLSGGEYDKIRCGHKHFEAIGTKVQFRESDSFEKLMESI